MGKKIETVSELRDLVEQLKRFSYGEALESRGSREAKIQAVGAYAALGGVLARIDGVEFAVVMAETVELESKVMGQLAKGGE